MTAEAWTSFKIGVCYGTSVISGIFTAIIADVSQASTQWVPVFIIGVITAATPGFLAWLQTRKIHEAVNSERTAMMEKVEAYHKEVVNLTLLKAMSDAALKERADAASIAAIKAIGISEEKEKAKQ